MGKYIGTLILLSLVLVAILTSCNSQELLDTNKNSKDQIDLEETISNQGEVLDLENANDKLDVSDEEVSLVDDSIESTIQDNTNNANTDRISEDLITVIESFIPVGWQILEAYGDELVEGDINHDDINDIVFVIEDQNAEVLSSPRRLIILSGKSEGGYKLELETDKAILPRNEGGIMGESFMGLSIEDNLLNISHNGGSTWRWASFYQFEFIDDSWYLVKGMNDWFNAVSDAGREYVEVDFRTGEYLLLETDDEGIEKTISDRKIIEGLISLDEFDIYLDYCKELID